MIKQITKLNSEYQNKMLRLFSKVDITTKLKILALQKKLIYKLKSVHDDVANEVLTLASLVLAVDSVAKELDSVNLNVVKMRGKNNKAKVKRQKVLGYWAIVRTLRLEEKMSFRDIATYFAKYHKLTVSYSTVYEMWIELENKTKTKEN